ncbi:uncharacterized protein [Clytia hemisphaerica]|uniref:uncharacterized protein n=1 Tax=Clytia hemisphaerica TaxID=252671 RepID=UPI0034D5BCD5
MSKLSAGHPKLSAGFFLADLVRKLCTFWRIFISITYARAHTTTDKEKMESEDGQFINLFNVQVEGYQKIQEFLAKRNIQFLLETFLNNKIDDDIAPYVENSKLEELGLVYGDIAAFRDTFSRQPTAVPTYKDRAKKLKMKIKKETTQLNAANKPIYIKSKFDVQLSLKCYEKKGYQLKSGKSTMITVERQADYDLIHTLARSYYNVPSETPTFIGNYRGKDMRNQFTTLEDLAAKLKEKKQKMHFYLYCSMGYSRLILNSFSNSSSSAQTSNSLSNFQDQQNQLSSSTLQTSNSLSNFQDQQNQVSSSTMQTSNSSSNFQNQQNQLSSSTMQASNSLSNFQNQQNQLSSSTLQTSNSLSNFQDQQNQLSSSTLQTSNSLSNFQDQQNQVSSSSMQISNSSSNFQNQENQLSSSTMQTSNSLSNFQDQQNQVSNSTMQASNSSSNFQDQQNQVSNSTMQASNSLSNFQDQHNQVSSSTTSNSCLVDQIFHSTSQVSRGTTTTPDRPTRPTRNTRPPARFRHSIGSPGLSFAANVFGMEEANKFLEEQVQDQSHENNQVETIDNDLDTAYDEYINRDRSQKSILVIRDENLFWNYLLRQEFDLGRQDIKIRFSGESGVDEGGLIAEFLTLAMRNFPKSPLVFGTNSVAFNNNTDSALGKQNHQVGQIVGLSILLYQRGPECLHPAIVRELFGLEQPNIIEPFDDGLIQHNLKKIKEGDVVPLLDQGIVPAGRPYPELEKLYLLSSLVGMKYQAISQFKDGINSVSASILKKQNFNTVKVLLEERKPITYCFEDFVLLFDYTDPKIQPGSNKAMKIRNCISEFELFLLNLGNGRFNYTYCDLLFLLTGLDRLPPNGGLNKIKVKFDALIMKASTCGPNLELPVLDCPDQIEKNMLMGLKFGSGFGTV